MWTPLFTHLQSVNDDVPSILAEALTTALVETAPRHRPGMEDDETRELASYRWTLGTWLLHFWRSDDGLAVPADARRDILARLARELMHGDDV